MFLVSLKEMHIDLFISNNLSNYAFMKYIEIEIFLLRLINFKTQWLYPYYNNLFRKYVTTCLVLDHFVLYWPRHSLAFKI